MQIKILVPTHVLPDQNTAVTLMFKKLLPVLKKKIKVHVTWFVYLPHKPYLMTDDIDEDSSVLFIQDYANAVDVIKKVKPDIIYAGAHWGFMDYAFSIAGKFVKVPVLSPMFSGDVFPQMNRNVIKANLTRFFQNSIPTDTIKTKKQFMRRGRFFIFKYLFLLKTQFSIKLNIIKIIKNFFMLLKVNLSDNPDTIDVRFMNSSHWLEGEILIEPLIKAGFPPSSLVLTGNPLYDEIFQKVKIISSIKSDKIRVLLLTASLYEHGFWTKKQRNDVLKKILTILSKYNNELSTIVKIHPTSEILSEYQSIINEVDTSIPIYQKEDLLQFINDSDVIISFSSFTSAVLQAVAAKKPIIICNFYNLGRDFLLDAGIAVECNESQKLISLIRQIFSNPPDIQKINKFIADYFYKPDGLASERLSEAIITLCKK